MPLLVRGLGADRFGVLALCWAAIGYAGLFDLGIGRGLTQIVSELLSEDDHMGAAGAIVGGLLAISALGLVGASICWLVTPWLVHRILEVPPSLQPETVASFEWLSCAIPMVLLGSGLRGVLEAYGRFATVNHVRIAMGTYNYAAPLAALMVTKNLAVLVSVLAVGRLITAAWYLYAVHRAAGLGRSVSVRSDVLTRLLKFGGWMTVTNVIGPLMTYMDRFMLATMVPVAIVAYYAAPYELVTRLLIVPYAVVGVLFPAFAATIRFNPAAAKSLLAKGFRYTLLILFPAVLSIVCVAQVGLHLLFGADFAGHGTFVLQALAIGVLFNSLAQLFFAAVQGAGRPDLTAILHVVELPFFIAFFVWMVRFKGVDGAAIAWAVRAAVDALVLFGLSQRFLSFEWRDIARTARWVAGCSLLLAVGWLPLPLGIRIAYSGAILLSAALWFGLRLKRLIRSLQPASDADGYAAIRSDTAEARIMSPTSNSLASNPLSAGEIRR